MTAIFLIMITIDCQAASGNKTMKLKDVALGQVVQVGHVKFVKIGDDNDQRYLALNLCPQGSTYSSFYKGCVVRTIDFAYTGNEQTFTTPADGYYVLEAWGAQGNTAYSGIAGMGGYAIGAVYLYQNDPLYVVVGSQSYNGAGKGIAGGGATHMASFGRGEIPNYKESIDELVIVAGGGGGGESAIGGSGGGFIGNNGSNHRNNYNNGDGGSQNAGGAGRTNNGKNPSGNINGAFGQGGNGKSSDQGAGGGGGFYGGGGTTYAGGGGGGSGYIGSENLLSLTNFPKHMTCYECLESTNSAILTFSNTCASQTPVSNCAKTGNGAARITQLSVYLGI